MKILLCEPDFAGHREKYCSCLAAVKGMEFFAYTPSNVGLDEEHFFSFPAGSGIRNFCTYVKWLLRIRRIVHEQGIDLVHFTDGDSAMRYMGLGFSLLKGVKVLFTFHHFFEGWRKRITYRRLLRGEDRSCVVHTEAIRASLAEIGCMNVRVVGYPVFDFDAFEHISTEDAKGHWGIASGSPVIGIVGGMVRYKNILPFLSAISGGAFENVHFLICGIPAEVSEEKIRRALGTLEETSILHFRRLSEEEYRLAIAASDIIYCIYDRSFDGASGPMVDGVCAGKLILACNHGSLGKIVTENHLGLTANCQDPSDMREKTQKAIESAATFQYDETAAAYRKSLRTEVFQKGYEAVYQELC